MTVCCVKKGFHRCYLYPVLVYICIWYGCSGEKKHITENDFENLELNSFVEEDFPYITTSLDARNIGASFPGDNVSARGLAIQLGNDSYACFDMDLLRWSVAWEGEFLPMVLPAQGSYHDFFQYNKNELPYPLGTPSMATGIYPGWSRNKPEFGEVRDASQETEGLYWGPIPTDLGRWNGVFIHNQSVILSYSIGPTEILELPGSVKHGHITALSRTFRIGKSASKLFVNIAEVLDGRKGVEGGQIGHLFHDNLDTVTTVAINGGDGVVKMVDNRYLTVELPPSNEEREFSILIRKGPARDTSDFEILAKGYKREIPDFKHGGPSRWNEQVLTRGKISPDTAAFVSDILTLPLPNPWKRNVRVADIGFFNGDKAAISTYEGDVWIVEGFNKKLNNLSWRRFASGFYEPMSIEVFEGEIYVYGKEGIVRLHDLNGDGEADYYEAYCNLMQQSTGTREWAADMTMDKDGNFYIAKGGHVTGLKGVLPFLSDFKPENTYRASTRHSGSILKIAADGKSLEVLATGLRMPYIGINRNTAFLTASDQQGNFVPASPIYAVHKGDYFGVPVTLHRDDHPEISRPITWIPHRIDRSSASQVWIGESKMGPLNNQLLHFSFGAPGIFRVLLDSDSETSQGGVSFIRMNYPSPILKGETNPSDGQLYVVGFNNYASNSMGISSLIRMRYTGKPSYMVNGFRAGSQGVLLSFDAELNDTSATNIENFAVKRWNYKRTGRYGSGHFKLDGSPGEELLPVLASYLAADKKSVLLLIPQMRETDQMEVMYRLDFRDGKKIEDGLWFTVHSVNDVAYRKYGIENVDLAKLDLTPDQVSALIKTELPVTVDRGRELFVKTGCIACHSTGLKTEGMYGPPFQGIYGTKRELTDGSTVLVDDAYLKESILQPEKKVAKGYGAEMPAFEGVLTDSDIQSIIFYIKTLYR